MGQKGIVGTRKNGAHLVTTYAALLDSQWRAQCPKYQKTSGLRLISLLVPRYDVSTFPCRNHSVSGIKCMQTARGSGMNKSAGPADGRRAMVVQQWLSLPHRSKNYSTPSLSMAQGQRTENRAADVAKHSDDWASVMEPQPGSFIDRRCRVMQKSLLTQICHCLAGHSMVCLTHRGFVKNKSWASGLLIFQIKLAN